jgi:hypothetical protein
MYDRHENDEAIQSLHELQNFKLLHLVKLIKVRYLEPA